MKASVVIVAAGSGRRIGQKKQFIALRGTPILKRSVAVFDKHDAIEHIVVVVSPEDVSSCSTMLADTSTPLIVTAGGASRSDSVRCGLDHLAHSKVVMIHDGVRPFVTPELISRLLENIEGYDACIPGLEVSDTLKEIHGDTVLKTVSRENLFQVQTPQAFISELIIRAHETRSEQATDDSFLIEKAGGKVRLVKGDPYNIKITLPEDILLAEAILTCRTE